jgi:hypothetical protein
MSDQISKRKFLAAAPALAGAAAFAPGQLAKADECAPATEGMSPVTYIAEPLQKQFEKNQELLHGTKYAEFLSGDLAVPASSARALRSGPLPEHLTLTPSVADLNKLLDPTIRFPDQGYALLDGPTAYAQSRIEMPGVTTQMFEWWFTWHPLDKKRYMLWYPHAHVENYVENPERLANASLSYAERIYNNPNHLTEFIGSSALPIVIHFTDPVKLGLDAAALKRAGFTANASGVIYTEAAPDAMFILMVHLARDTDRGLELFSRYWIGAHPEFARFPGGAQSASLLNKMGMSKDAIASIGYEMAVHDMTEFNVLKRILPRVYKTFAT